MAHKNLSRRAFLAFTAAAPFAAAAPQSKQIPIDVLAADLPIDGCKAVAEKLNQRKSNGGRRKRGSGPVFQAWSNRKAARIALRRKI
jgi:hypothetical protein